MGNVCSVYGGGVTVLDTIIIVFMLLAVVGVFAVIVSAFAGEMTVRKSLVFSGLYLVFLVSILVFVSSVRSGG